MIMLIFLQLLHLTAIELFNCFWCKTITQYETKTLFWKKKSIRFLSELHKNLPNSSGEMLPNPRKALKNRHHKNISGLIFAQYNVNSLGNKFDSL